MEKKPSLRLEDWREVVDVDWPEHEVTQQTVRTTMLASSRYRTPVRQATGRVMTNKEYDARHKRAYRPLP